MSGTWQGLVAAIAAPNLPAARCKGRAGEWVDITEPEEIEYAITRCRRCPELSGCAEYRSRLKRTERRNGENRMTAPDEYAEPPHVAVAGTTGIWVQGIGVLRESDAESVGRWLFAGVKKLRARKAVAQPTVTRTAVGVHVPGVGELKSAAALALATAIADALTVTPATAGGDRRPAPPEG